MKPGNKIALISLALVVCGLLFFQTPLMRSARDFTWDVVVRSSGRFFQIGTLDVDKNTLSQLEDLQAKNASLESQLKNYRYISAQIGGATISSLRAVPAYVVGRPVDTYQSRFVLNKGIADGVGIGAPVVISGSTLVGFIVDAGVASSTFEFLFSPALNLTVEVASADPDVPAARGLLSGQYYTSMLLSTIPRNIALTEGLPVFTTLSERVPHGLLIGTLAHITNRENEPYQTAYVVPNYTPKAVHAVTILVQP